MATNTSEMFAEMFSGWSSVRSHKDLATGDTVVTLTLDSERRQWVRESHALYEGLKPKRVRMFNGVRFHGRLVGRRHD